MPTLAELLAAYPPGNRTPLERALVEEVERLERFRDAILDNASVEYIADYRVCCVDRDGEAAIEAERQRWLTALLTAPATKPPASP